VTVVDRKKIGKWTTISQQCNLQGKPGIIGLWSCPIFVIVDGGASSKSTADPTAIATFAVAPDGDLIVLNVHRERIEVEDVVPILNDICSVWKPDWVGIESNGFQVWFVKTARDKMRFPHIPTVRELEPEGKGKSSRAAPAIIRAEQGSIWLPYSNDHTNPWVGAFEEELYGFTGKEGRPDDRTDMLFYVVLSLDRFGYAQGTLTEDELPAGVRRRPGAFSHDAFWMR